MTKFALAGYVEPLVGLKTKSVCSKKLFAGCSGTLADTQNSLVKADFALDGVKFSLAGSIINILC